MSRTTTFITVAAAGTALLIVLAIVVGFVMDRLPEPSPKRVVLSEEALTPEELDLHVTPQADGTLHVSERLIFDIPEDLPMPVYWFVGGESIGWQHGVGDGPQYIVTPTVTEVTARELGTGADSTKDDPAEVAELTVDRDDSDVDDSVFDSIRYEISPPISTGETTSNTDRSDQDPSGTGSSSEGPRWSVGRHVVDVSYTLDDVFLDIEGHELFVLPLSFPAGSSKASSVRTVAVDAGGSITCLPDNTAFEPDEKCSGIDEHRLDGAGSRLTWRSDLTASVNAIGFAAPESVHADPIPVPEHRRS